MFSESIATNRYFKLINHFRAGKSPGSERHHIAPKSCGGLDVEENLVYIPARVHYILHKLLVRIMTLPEHKKKMRYALWRMMNPQSKTHQRHYIVTSTDYETQRSHQKRCMVENNPMKRPEISAQFRRVRPDQSEVATRRNIKYWESRKTQPVDITCKWCNKPFSTTNLKRAFCTKSCAARFTNSVRVLVNKEPA